MAYLVYVHQSPVYSVIPFCVFVYDVHVPLRAAHSADSFSAWLEGCIVVCSEQVYHSLRMGR